MSHEWEQAPGAIHRLEWMTEDFEQHMTADLPAILDNLVLDLFDGIAPAVPFDELEQEAYEAAAKNVVGNLKRLLAEDAASIEAIRQMQARRKPIRNSSTYPVKEG